MATIKTVRPNSTVSNTGELKGAASAHAALSDDFGTSYIVLDNGEGLECGFPDLSLPAGALIKSVAVRVSTNLDHNDRPSSMSAGLSGGLDSYQVISWKNMTITTVYYEEKSYSEAEINAKNLVLESADIVGTPFRANEMYLDVVYVNKPKVAVDKPGFEEDNTPVITWADTLSPLGGSQTHYQVKIFDDATYGGGGFNPASSIPDYDSEVVESGVQLNPELELPLDNDTYKAYVRVAQTVNGAQFWSEWTASSAFTVNAPLPHSPKITVSADDANARLTIKVSEDTDGTVKASTYDVQRSVDAGATWQDVRTLEGEGVLTAGKVELWDYEVPNGTKVKYRLRSHNAASNSRGDWKVTAEFSWKSGSIWLKDPYLPATSIHNPASATVRSFPSQTRDTGASVHKVLGRPDPIVLRDEGGPIYESGEIVIMTESQEDRDAVDALLESGHPLLLQFPENADEPDRYLEITGNFQRERIVNKSFATPRDETMPWQEIDQPSGPVESWT